MPTAETEFAAEAASVAAARRFVTAVLEQVGAHDAVWTATQLVSELVTNAVVHAGTAVGVEIAVEADQVRIGVSDGRPQLTPTPRHFSDSTTNGRGLQLVNVLSSSWGIEAMAGSKTVWCQFERHRTRPTRTHPEVSVSSSRGVA